MNFPEELYYTQEHEWVKFDGEHAYIGITDFAQNELGDIVFVDVTMDEDDELDKDEIFGSVEAVKTTSDLFMPIAGVLVEKNEALEETPETVNSDPYGEGWMIKIKPTGQDRDNLMKAEDYKKEIGKD